jgi:formylglycine-generating enzyme required for sulfatase activity
MGKFVVTQEQYIQIQGTNPSVYTDSKDNPVERVFWEDAQNLCKMLAEKTKQSVRLPTEAEWEYACRAGTTTTYYSGDSEADLDKVGWYAANSKNTTHPVGQKAPNAFGLYDMHGNVWQWCQDWYGADYYGKAPNENPEGPAQGDVRLVRGGSWYYIPEYCRSAFRSTMGPGHGYDPIGFRVVVSASKPP